MFAVPDNTVPEAGASHRPLPPATLLRAVAADQDRWRRLIAFAPDAPTRVRVRVDHRDLELWLRGWLPGQAAPVGPPEVMFAVVLGTIAELGSGGWRGVEAGQTRILGQGYHKRLANRAMSPAVTLHAAARHVYPPQARP